jgi:hypothetical protein
MQVHFSCVSKIGNTGRYRVDCEAYSGFADINPASSGSVDFAPTPPAWFKEKAVEQIWQQALLEKDFALYVYPPNAD